MTVYPLIYYVVVWSTLALHVIPREYLIQPTACQGNDSAAYMAGANEMYIDYNTPAGIVSLLIFYLVYIQKSKFILKDCRQVKTNTTVWLSIMTPYNMDIDFRYPEKQYVLLIFSAAIVQPIYFYNFKLHRRLWIDFLTLYSTKQWSGIYLWWFCTCCQYDLGKTLELIMET